jgi:hypothetical protein
LTEVIRGPSEQLERRQREMPRAGPLETQVPNRSEPTGVIFGSAPVLEVQLVKRRLGKTFSGQRKICFDYRLTGALVMARSGNHAFVSEPPEIPVGLEEGLAHRIGSF